VGNYDIKTVMELTTPFSGKLIRCPQNRASRAERPVQYKVLKYCREVNKKIRVTLSNLAPPPAYDTSEHLRTRKQALAISAFSSLLR